MSDYKITTALCDWISNAGGTPTEEDEKSITHAMCTLYYALGGEGEIPPQFANNIASLINGISYVASGGIEPTGTINITQNGEVDVTEYAMANVNVPVPQAQTAVKLLKTEDIGHVTVTSTTAVSLDKTITVTGAGAYDILIVVATAANPTLAGGKNYATVSTMFLVGGNGIHSKTSVSNVTTKWYAYSSTSLLRSGTITNSAGVYANSPSVSSGTVTFTMYGRVDNYTSVGTVDDDYTVRVYGIILNPTSDNNIVKQITA